MGTRRVLVGVALATTVAVLPAFLLGSQGVQLQRDLSFDPFALGLAVALAWIAASVLSTPLGHLSERLGGGRALTIAALTSAAAQLGIAALARSWAVLAVGSVIGGAANALAQPSANLLIHRAVPEARHGLGFAVKQSAIPFATLLGGLAVPTLTLVVGWRWTFVAGGMLALLAAALVPRHLEAGPAPAHVTPRRPLRSRLGPLAVLGAGVGFGAAAAGGLTAFLTSGSVDAGVAEGAAGLLLAAGSGIGIAVRLAMGARADRSGRDQLPVVALMMAIGAAAFVVLAAQLPVAYVLATPFAFGAGWAWPGLFNLSVVRRHPDAPAVATGVTQTGTYLGAALGPLAFGAIVEGGTYPPAWLLGALLLVLGAVAMLVGRALLPSSATSSRPAGTS